MEQWKDIKGYEGAYQISNLGRIKSLDRICVEMPRGCKRHIKGKLMSPTDNGKGYMIISLKKHGTRKSKYIHRLVAEAFIPNPNSYTIVNHIDYNKKNNNVNNLEWCTQKDNIQHSSKNMRKPHNCKSSTGHKYITQKSKKYALYIRYKKLYKSFEKLEDAIAFRDEVLNGNSIATE
jgi:hypothetical protein